MDGKGDAHAHGKEDVQATRTTVVHLALTPSSPCACASPLPSMTHVLSSSTNRR
jgi:hypothetical protein